MTDDARLARRRARRRAADRQHSRTPAPISPTFEAALRQRRGWRARTPTGGSDELYDFAASARRDDRANALSRSIIDVNRDPERRLALSRPGDDRALPDHDLRRRAALSRRARRQTRPRSPSGGGSTSIPITQRSPARSRACAQTHQRVALYDAHSIRSRHSAPVRRRAAACSISARIPAPAARRDLRERGRRACSRRAAQAFVVDGRFKGGWITRALRRPERRRSTRCRWSSPAAPTCRARARRPRTGRRRSTIVRRRRARRSSACSRRSSEVGGS